MENGTVVIRKRGAERVQRGHLWVYRTDIASARTAIAAVSIPPELNVRAEYPIAVLKGSRHPELAAAWIELLTSSAGRTVLSELGFLPPTDDARKRP